MDISSSWHQSYLRTAQAAVGARDTSTQEGGIDMNNAVFIGAKRVVTGVIVALVVTATTFLIVASEGGRFWNVTEKAPIRSVQSDFKVNPQRYPLSGKPVSYGVSKICFVRAHDVYLVDLAKGAKKRIVAGEDCNISPTGNAIAFTVYSAELNKVGHPKTIKIFDLTNDTTNELEFLPKSHKANPQWSPDGTKVAFEIAINHQTHIGILNIASSEWQDVTRKLDFLESGGEVNGYGLALDSWAPDGKSIVCQDSKFIYEIALDGSTLQKRTIETIADRREVEILGNMRFSYSPDRRLMSFWSSSELKTGKINLAIYIFDFEKEKLLRITPETIEASNPVWLPSGRDIMFQRLQERRDNVPVWDLCTISANGNDLRTILLNASYGSYSRTH
jgi:tricorn protease-like protein